MKSGPAALAGFILCGKINVAWRSSAKACLVYEVNYIRESQANEGEMDSPWRWQTNLHFPAQSKTAVVGKNVSLFTQNQSSMTSLGHFQEAVVFQWAELGRLSLFVQRKSFLMDESLLRSNSSGVWTGDCSLLFSQKLLISSREQQQQHSGLTKLVFTRITIGFNVVKAQGARFMSMKSWENIWVQAFWRNRLISHLYLKAKRLSLKKERAIVSHNM